MALTLDPTLATAQDSNNRKPIVEIISDQFTGALPFHGQYFNTETDDEIQPEIIAHSDGRIIGAYVKEHGSGNYHAINLTHTNADRTMWSDVQIYTGLSGINDISKLSVCELDNGDIGIVFVENSSSTSYLRRIVVTVDGTVVSSASTIESWSRSTYWVDSPHVVNLDSGYRMVYGFGDITADNGSGEFGIWSRTSSDFLTWDADSLYYDGGHASYYKRDNPFLAIPPSGEAILFYDAVTSLQADGSYISNIFKAESLDLTTWTSGEAMTNLTTYGYRYNTPSADFMSDNSCYLVYTQVIDVLHSIADDWEMCDSAWCGLSSNQNANGMDFDEVNRELYFITVYSSIGSKALCNCTRINVDTWEIVEQITNATTPGFHDIFANTEDTSGLHVWWDRNQQGAPYFSCGTCVSVSNGGWAFIYDTRDQGYKQYNFNDNATYGLTKNIDVDFRPQYPGQYPTMSATWMDANTNRLYICWIRGSTTGNLWFGYVDYTEAADPTTGKYPYHEIFYDPGILEYGAYATFEGMKIVPEANLAIFYASGLGTSWRGQILVYTLDGSLYKNYYHADNPAIHHQGANHVEYYNGKLYCSFDYLSAYGQEDRRGLMVIDLATDAVTYETPTYEVGIDDYSIHNSALTGDGRIVWGTGYGLMMYDPAGGTWTEYSNDTVDGFCGPFYTYYYDYVYGGVAYDPVNHTMFGGIHTNGFFNGILGVSELGSWGQTSYRTGTLGAGWTFGAEADATVGMTDTWGSIAVDEEDAWWMLWTRRDADEQSNKWANSNSIKNLSDYLTDSVEATWNLDQPNTLRFSLAHGYLFDPTNMASTWSRYTQRGRVMTLRFGENVDGTPYWQNQGEFVIQSSRLNYSRGTDPILNVDCADITALWAEHNITCSTYYSEADPEDVLEDLITDFGMLTADQYDIPTPFTNTHAIFHQWIDSTLVEALDDVLSHFGYISNVNMDGNWSVKEIDFDKTPDHVYTNQTKIVEYSPDDSYATYTNKVTVKGEGRYFIEVSYPEENMGNVSGTLGWWGCEEEKTFYYSEDQQQTCSSPRIVVVEPPNINILFTEKGGGSVVLTSEDADGKYIVITVSAPNLIWVLIAAVAAMIAIGYAALSCDGYLQSWCGVYIWMLSLAMQVVAYILGCEANYSVDVYARPTGHEKQTFQASAEDTDLMNELNGLVIEEVIDDALCYDQSQCYRVANYELDIVMAQRKRINFKKIAHLQDEITDVVTIVHPYSNLSHNIMIANLTRTFEIPDSPQSDVGFFDSIEGWRLE